MTKGAPDGAPFAVFRGYGRRVPIWASAMIQPVMRPYPAPVSAHSRATYSPECTDRNAVRKPAAAAAKTTAPQPLKKSARLPRARDSSAPARRVRNRPTNTMNRIAFRSCASRSRTGVAELKDHAGQASVRRNSPPAVSGLVLWLTQSTKIGLPNTRTRRNATKVPTPVAVRRRVLVRAMNANARSSRFSNGWAAGRRAREQVVVGENGEPVVHPLGVGQVAPVAEQVGVGDRQPPLDLVDLQCEGALPGAARLRGDPQDLGEAGRTVHRIERAPAVDGER